MRKNMLRTVARLQQIDTAAYTNASGDFSFDLSGVSFQTNDIGVFWFADDGWDTDVTITDWTLRADATVSGNCNGGFYVRLMTGSETEIASSAGDSLLSTVGLLVIYRGAREIEAGDAAANNSTFGGPNPPQAARSANDDSLILVGGYDGGNDADITGAPSNYTEILKQNNTSGTAEITSMIAYDLGDATQPDPGAFSGTSLSDVNGAATLIITPQ